MAIYYFSSGESGNYIQMSTSCRISTTVFSVDRFPFDKLLFLMEMNVFRFDFLLVIG